MCEIQGSKCCQVSDSDAWAQGYEAGNNGLRKATDTARVMERVKLTRIIQHYRDTKQFHSVAAQALLPEIVNEILQHVAEAE